jgi:serine/threonine protein kinase
VHSGLDFEDGMEGDCRYMAPEVLRLSCGGKPTPAVDVFSLGITIFELAARICERLFLQFMCGC